MDLLVSSDNYGVIVKLDDEFWVGDWAAPWIDQTNPQELMTRARAFIANNDKGLTHLPDVTSDDEAEEWIYDNWQIEYGCLFLDLNEDEAGLRDFTPEYHAVLDKFSKALEHALDVTLLGENDPDEQTEELVRLGIPRDALFLVIETMLAYAQQRNESEDEAKEQANHLIAGAVLGMLTASKYKEQKDG